MFQTIILAGNLGRDPEMRFTPGGDGVTSFPVAVNSKYTDKSGEKVEETTWFRISAWGKLAETCNQYLRKGSKVLVEGKLQADKITGNPKVYAKKDGTAGASYEIRAHTVRFLSSKSEDERAADPVKYVAVADEPVPWDDD